MKAAATRLVFVAPLLFVGFQLAPARAEQLASSTQDPQARQSPQTALVLNERFDSGARGWAGKNSRITVLRRGAGKRFAVRVSPARDGRKVSKERFSLYAAPRPVRCTDARQVYVASARIRAVQRTGNRVCLKLREIKRGKILRSAATCVPSRKGWRYASVRLVASRSGSQVGVVVESLRKTRFDVDTVNVAMRTLASANKCRGRKCPPPPPPPPPPTTTTTTAPGTTTTAPPPPPTTTTTTTAPPPPPPPPTPSTLRFGNFETAFAGFDQTNAAPGPGIADPTTLTVVTGRAYDGLRSAAVHTSANATGANKYSRAIFHNLTWSAGTDIWYGCAFYLPTGFHSKQQGQIDLMRWDDWVDDPSTTDRGGIVIYGPPATGKAYLINARLGGAQSELVGPFSISEDKWHWLEVHQRFSANHASDISEVYLDGNLVGSSTARNWNDRRITSIRFGVVALNDATQSKPVDLWFDRASLSASRLGPLG